MDRGEDNYEDREYLEMKHWFLHFTFEVNVGNDKLIVKFDNLRFLSFSQVF